MKPSGYFDVYQGTDGSPSYIQIKPELADKTSVKLYTLPDINIEVDAWKHLSVTAIAAENQSVAEYVNELEARAAAAEKDAKRLQFLVDNEDFQIEYTGELTLREHIDTAMGEKK